MQKFAIQLVWKEVNEKNETVQTFRYTEEGIFKTSSNEEHKLNEKNFINLLYFPEISEKSQKNWKENFENGNIKQLINQMNIPIYKLTEKNQEKIEILDYNNKKFLVNRIRKKSSELGFEIIYGNDGTGYGSYKYDKKSDIKIVILTNPFFPGEYTKTLQIEKILFLKNNEPVQFEKPFENQDIKFLKLKEVPARILSLACFMAEILEN